MEIILSDQTDGYKAGFLEIMSKRKSLEQDEVEKMETLSKDDL